MTVLTRARVALAAAGVAAVALLGSITAAPALAADEAAAPVEMTLSPTRIDVDLQPGQSIKGEMTVINSGTEAFTFNVYATPYSVTNDDYDPNFNEESARTQISRWITFDKPSYVAEAGQTLQVPYTITIPTDVPDGGQYAVIFAETEPAPTNQTGVSSTHRVGLLVYADLPGTTRYEGSATQSSVDFLQTSTDLTLTDVVKNTGNTDFQATSTYRLLDIFGNEVSTASEQMTLLPDTDRRKVLTATGANPLGLYTLERTTTWLDQTESHSTLLLFALPIVMLIAAGIVLAGIAITLVIAIRRRIRSRTIVRRIGYQGA